MRTPPRKASHAGNGRPTQHRQKDPRNLASQPDEIQAGGRKVMCQQPQKVHATQKNKKISECETRNTRQYFSPCQVTRPTQSNPDQPSHQKPTPRKRRSVAPSSVCNRTVIPPVIPCQVYHCGVAFFFVGFFFSFSPHRTAGREKNKLLLTTPPSPPAHAKQCGVNPTGKHFRCESYRGAAGSEPIHIPSTHPSRLLPHLR